MENMIAVVSHPLEVETFSGDRHAADRALLRVDTDSMVRVAPEVNRPEPVCGRSIR